MSAHPREDGGPLVERLDFVGRDHPLVPPALAAADYYLEHAYDGVFETTGFEVVADPDGNPVVYGTTVIETYRSWWAPLALVDGRAAWTGPWVRCEMPEDWTAEQIADHQGDEPPALPDLEDLR